MSAEPLAGVGVGAAGSLAAVDQDLATAPAWCPAPPLVGAPERPSGADDRMRRLLRLPADGPTVTEASARTMVERSLLISMVRCLLTYIVLPFVLPVLGIGLGVAPAIGMVVGAVAIAANVASVRRFWRADHRYRWHYTAFAGLIVAMLAWLMLHDVLDLLA